MEDSYTSLDMLAQKTIVGDKLLEKDAVPQHHELMNPLLKALYNLGGSGSVDEINQTVVANLDLPDEVLNVPHDPEHSNRTEVEYRLAWARTYLKKYGVIDNSTRGVWAIVPDKKHIQQVDPSEVVRAIREQTRQKQVQEVESVEDETETDEVPEEARSWRAKLHHALTKDLSSDAFERLTKRLLRESGFVQVEVTGRTGDGGIDGKGIVRISDLLSFHVVFQCKRYQGSVSAAQVRDFRGASVGRADKGLFVTTGYFTREAIREATRDGASPIDLIDGDQLADKLKELGLGVRTETEIREIVYVDEDWFQQI